MRPQNKPKTPGWSAPNYMLAPSKLSAGSWIMKKQTMPSVFTAAPYWPGLWADSDMKCLLQKSISCHWLMLLVPTCLWCRLTFTHQSRYDIIILFAMECGWLRDFHPMVAFWCSTSELFLAVPVLTNALKTFIAATGKPFPSWRNPASRLEKTRNKSRTKQHCRSAGG